MTKNRNYLPRQTNPSIADVTATLGFDRLDSLDFPTSGFLAQTRLLISVEELGASSGFSQQTGMVSIPLTAGLNTLLLRSDFGETFSTLPVERSFS